jgi:hypothetical protein
MSGKKKLLHSCFLAAFIYMMMCPVVHALHDRYIGHAVNTFPLHSIVQKFIPGDARHYQDEMGSPAVTAHQAVKLGPAYITPQVFVINPANNLSIVSTTRLNR